MKRIVSLFSLILLAAVLLCCLTACDLGTKKPEDGKLSVISTIFPEYDWVKNVLGDNPADVELTLLLDSGVDLHNYQPTAADILKISACDVFIYVGGESDSWVADVLRSANNKKMVAINLLDVLGDAVKEEEVVEGMQGEDEHEHEDGDHDHEDEEEAEMDEHVWLSLRNAQVIVTKISEELQKLDSAHADVYRKNAEAYIEKLKALDGQYKAAVDGAARKTLLFADRFPFRYLADDYGLSYYAAFVGCSAESEASFETITFLAEKVDELNLPVVMTIEKPNHRIAETVISTTKAKNQKILAMDSLQSTTAQDVKNGATYLAAMEANLTALTEALK
ncbi:MAG: zinc ABC transporter substrate-binding protein [Lachnospiraceae bacterium]|nr:zinc ABC transporter substrate-binding protein [Lachnospiraceae bacterium]